VIREVDGIADDARQSQDPATGTLRLGLFPTLAPYLLPHIVPEVHRRFPDLELLLVEEKSEVLHQQVRDGSLDAVLLARPVHDEQLHEQFLFEEPFVLAVPVGHPLAAVGEPIPTSVLAGEQLLLLEEGHCLRDQALSVCQLAGGGERRGFRATSLETLRQMVAAGVGMTLLPELATIPPVAASEDVVLVPFADPVPRREVALYWRRSSAFRDFLPDLADVIARSSGR
jgi:LysR family hydrogen peroxide-inducible transcriptional activator